MNPPSEPDARSKSAVNRYVRSQAHHIHKLKAKDSTGRWAYYFVLIPPVRERGFLKAIDGPGMLDLEDWGRVIASCYGEEPTEEVLQFLREEYGFDL
jgi:hypothetical protein